MIYAWIEEWVHLFKSIRHWFRALTCRSVIYYHGCRMCEADGEFDRWTSHACEYWWCPKRKAEVV